MSSARAGRRVSRTVLLLFGLTVLTSSGTAWAQEPNAGLQRLLDRAGSRIEEFWDEYGAVTSTEDVRQLRMDSDGEILGESRSRYDYLLVMKLEGSRLDIEESRIRQDATEVQSDGPFLVTNGFSTLLLIFHPLFRTSFEYAWGSESQTDPELRQVAFRAIRGERSPSVLRLDGRDYPIEWHGTAWLDPQTGMVTRIEAAIGDSMADLGLQALEARTEYAETTIGDSQRRYWLPSATAIEARSEHQYWRNEHHFMGYRLFAVDSRLDISVGAEDR